MKNGASRFNFTKRDLDKLQPTSERYYVHDTGAQVRGLILAVQPTGAKSFFLYRRIKGRPRYVRIGGFPAVSIEKARGEALKLVAEIEDKGDPSKRKREQKVERNRFVLASVWDHYRTTHLEPKTSLGSLREDERRYEKHLAKWATWTLDEIDFADVADLHKKIGEESPCEANSVIELLKRTINHASKRMGWRGSNPCKHVENFPKPERERFLDGLELARLYSVLSGNPVPADPKKSDGDTFTVDPDVRDFIKLALLTGARRRNVLTMRWSDLDLERGLWRIPAKESKSKKAMTVILPAPAVELLKVRTRLENVDEVFRRADGKLPGVVKQWDAIRKAAAIPDVRIHDLRRTLGSWAAGTGASLPIIGKALGHSSPDATAIYARLDVDPVRRAIEVATSAMLRFDPTATPRMMQFLNSQRVIEATIARPTAKKQPSKTAWSSCEPRSAVLRSFLRR